MTDDTAGWLRDEPVSFEVEQSDLVYSGHVWDVRHDTVRYGDGQIVRDYVQHTGAVAVVALDDEGRMLVLQQYRHPIRARDWELPAGLLDVEGEPPAETAKRELAEEADLVAAEWEPLLSFHTSPGGSDETLHVFLARGLSAAPQVHERTEEEQDIRVEWVAVDDVITAVLAGRVRNGVLALGAFAAAEHLRRAGAAGR
ncbi:NUDIX hydrolase [Microbacterium sp. zg.Y1090]|uniref:NUDIX domain-containing protein n=1 Tax=Microbacterium wangruii TaxID=3049073 RepID=UPI00214D5853|nr:MULTISPECIES: NUDIX hydrolase [unclassified Microbacterium]MCR2819983.1 NUDIX hydrolase [Microbacterium sp. zg.Y1090]MDL5488146.1 NUDIX hydrolase [Microbacterium sp. zg-Y1211]WIM27532.1 NUDIX hydrolase [Microbacterium sp. zg-Y1090]